MSAELPDDDSLKSMSLQSFTASALFERTFDEGMELVEECARISMGATR
jgi:regulator of CtrA degradation